MLLQIDRFEQFCEQIVATLTKMHDEFPLRFKHSRQELEARFSYLESTEILKAAIKHLKGEKKIELNESSIGLVGRGPKLSKGEKQLIQQLTEQIKMGGTKPPAIKELIDSAKKNKDSVNELLRLAGENGDLIPVSKDFFFHHDVMEETKAQLRDQFAVKGSLTMSDIRQVIDTSRKYAIPLCEYFDSIGFTQRDGDTRRLGTG